MVSCFHKTWRMGYRVSGGMKMKNKIEHTYLVAESFDSHHTTSPTAFCRTDGHRSHCQARSGIAGATRAARSDRRCWSGGRDGRARTYWPCWVHWSDWTFGPNWPDGSHGSGGRARSGRPCRSCWTCWPNWTTGADWARREPLEWPARRVRAGAAGAMGVQGPAGPTWGRRSDWVPAGPAGTAGPGVWTSNFAVPASLAGLGNGTIFAVPIGTSTAAFNFEAGTVASVVQVPQSCTVGNLSVVALNVQGTSTANVGLGEATSVSNLASDTLFPLNSCTLKGNSGAPISCTSTATSAVTAGQFLTDYIDAFSNGPDYQNARILMSFTCH